MLDIPIEDVLILPYLLENFDPKFIKDIFHQHFIYDNLRIHITSKKFEGLTEEVEHFF